MCHRKKKRDARALRGNRKGVKRRCELRKLRNWTQTRQTGHPGPPTRKGPQRSRRGKRGGLQRDRRPSHPFRRDQREAIHPRCGGIRTCWENLSSCLSTYPEDPVNPVQKEVLVTGPSGLPIRSFSPACTVECETDPAGVFCVPFFLVTDS
jgi:hypothetical protein